MFDQSGNEVAPGNDVNLAIAGPAILNKTGTSRLTLSGDEYLHRRDDGLAGRIAG